jgi:NADP-dependent alcohol dehydrogenase
MLTVLKDKKRAKLLQYGERVWGLAEGSEDERIDEAIAKTKEFFETMQLKTNLRDHGLTPENIPEILDSLRAHDMVQLGEHKDVTPEVVRQALELCF